MSYLDDKLKINKNSLKIAQKVRNFFYLYSGNTNTPKIV